jgi:hypothetical protein
MKGLFIPLSLIALLFTGCFDDDEKLVPEYLEFGVIEGSSSSNFLIKADSKVVLKPVEGLDQSLTLEDGARVLVKYSVVQAFVDEDYDFTIKILEMRDVLTQPILHVTSDTIRDTLSYESVTINSAWIAQDFLNVFFEYYIDIKSYNDKITTNYFYVSLDPQDQFESGTPIKLNFHHNNNENDEVRVEGVLSVPITELRKPIIDSVNIPTIDSVMIRLIRKDNYSTSYTDIEYKYELEEDAE